jgi:hypothetical protein
MKKLALLVTLALILLHFACGSVAQVTCPASQHLEGNLCVANASGLSCGPGTRNEGGVCLPASAACADGMALVGGQCVAYEGRVACGRGTVLMGNLCQSIPDVKPILTDSFGLSVIATEVIADGYSKVPVLVSARRPDGTFIEEKFVFGFNRVDAGSVVPPSVVTVAGAATLDLVGCSSVLLGNCIGKARVTMARASEPDVIVAQSNEFALVAPEPVYSARNCTALPNMLYFDGESEDSVHPGQEAIFEGQYNSSPLVEPFGTGIKSLGVDYLPATRYPRDNFVVYVDSAGIGQALQRQVYRNVVGRDREGGNLPLMFVHVGERWCTSGAGAFQIHALTLDANKEVSEALISFEQRCNGSTAALRGCMHYTR